ncbi:hypothetical protein ACE4RU_11975, partial [Actinobacillus seminis]
CKLQYVALAVAMGLSFSGSALAEDINLVVPKDQEKALAYDFNKEIAYLREKPGEWVELGVHPDKARKKSWSDVEKLTRISEGNSAHLKILIRTVENVKELDRFLSDNILDTAKNKKALTALQASHD